jgi:hypothetical protein
MKNLPLKATVILAYAVLTLLLGLGIGVAFNLLDIEVIVDQRVEVRLK